jgi:hypothetical protein
MNLKIVAQVSLNGSVLQWSRVSPDSVTVSDSGIPSRTNFPERLKARQACV